MAGIDQPSKTGSSAPAATADAVKSIFISYASQDIVAANKLCAALEAAGGFDLTVVNPHHAKALRKRKTDRTVPLDEPIDTGEEMVNREIAVWEDNPEQRYSQEEMQQILNEAVQDLKPDFRTVFVLRDIEELSTEETAETLGISVPAVKSRLLRARLALRERLTRQFKRKGENLLGYL